MQPLQTVRNAHVACFIDFDLFGGWTPVDLEITADATRWVAFPSTLPAVSLFLDSVWLEGM